MQNGSSVGIRIQYTHCIHVFARADLYAQSELINKISASELSRKFVKSALLVGYIESKHKFESRTVLHYCDVLSGALLYHFYACRLPQLSPRCKCSSSSNQFTRRLLLLAHAHFHTKKVEFLLPTVYCQCIRRGSRSWSSDSNFLTGRKEVGTW